MNAQMEPRPATLPGTAQPRSALLRQMLLSEQLEFIMEAHNGISARVVREAGFQGIWGSGLTISAQYGVRDNNEASWTQVVDMLEFMADASDLPILLDGDTGYGNFNNMRRPVRKLEQRGIAGVCIEDHRCFSQGRHQPGHLGQSPHARGDSRHAERCQGNPRERDAGQRGLRERPDFDTLDMPALMNALIAAGASIEVLYVHGHWRGVNDLEDFRQAVDFAHAQTPFLKGGA